jgi:hypothetical protein
MNDSCTEDEPAKRRPDPDSAGAQMWVRIAGAIEREAERCPPGEDRDLAMEWATELRKRLRPRKLP